MAWPDSNTLQCSRRSELDPRSSALFAWLRSMHVLSFTQLGTNNAPPRPRSARGESSGLVRKPSDH
jgi:hypothetical protein